MAFLAQIFAWIVSDIRHIIIIVLSILLIGMGLYSLSLRWQVLDTKIANNQLQIDNEKLKINNVNLSAQVEQLSKANGACNAYITKIFNSKDKAKKVNERIDLLKGTQDEIILGNDLANSWNSNR